MLNVAFVGKGGAGKSTIAGTMARMLARRGEPVLTIDSDPMPGLSVALGLGTPEAGLPDDATVAEVDGERTTYRLRMTPAESIDAYAATGADGVRYLQFGKLHGHVKSLGRSQAAFRQIIADLPREQWHVIGDLPGGTRQPFFGWGDYADTFVIVVEPNAKGLLSARRLARLAPKGEKRRIVVVVNKAREGDAELVAARTGLEVIAAVPAKEHFRDADRAGVAPLDHLGVVADDPGLDAVRSVLDNLLGKVVVQ